MITLPRAGIISNGKGMLIASWPLAEKHHTSPVVHYVESGRPWVRRGLVDFESASAQGVMEDPLY